MLHLVKPHSETVARRPGQHGQEHCNVLSVQCLECCPNHVSRLDTRAPEADLYPALNVLSMLLHHLFAIALSAPRARCAFYTVTSLVCHSFIGMSVPLLPTKYDSDMEPGTSNEATWADWFHSLALVAVAGATVYVGRFVMKNVFAPGTNMQVWVREHRPCVSRLPLLKLIACVTSFDE